MCRLPGRQRPDLMNVMHFLKLGSRNRGPFALAGACTCAQCSLYLGVIIPFLLLPLSLSFPPFPSPSPFSRFHYLSLSCFSSFTSSYSSCPRLCSLLLSFSVFFSFSSYFSFSFTFSLAFSFFFCLLFFLSYSFFPFLCLFLSLFLHVLFDLSLCFRLLLFCLSLFSSLFLSFPPFSFLCLFLSLFVCLASSNFECNQKGLASNVRHVVC